MATGNFQRNFTIRITKWITKTSAENLSHKDLGTEGRDYIIKRNNKNRMYAIFIHNRNKLRRIEDKRLIKKVSLVDLILVNLPNKKEGISILKTISMSL